MGMAAILFNGAEPFDQIVNILSTEGPMWNLVYIVHAVSEKKTFKDFTILTRVVRRQRSSPERADRIRKQFLNIKD